MGAVPKEMGAGCEDGVPLLPPNNGPPEGFEMLANGLAGALEPEAAGAEPCAGCGPPKMLGLGANNPGADPEPAVAAGGGPAGVVDRFPSPIPGLLAAGVVVPGIADELDPPPKLPNGFVPPVLAAPNRVGSAVPPSAPLFGVANRLGAF